MQARRISEVLLARIRELWRRTRVTAPRLGRAALEHALDVKTRASPWLRREAEIEGARLRLWQATLEHDSSLLAARMRLVRARRGHASSCRRAGRAAATTEKEATRVVSRATERFRELCRPQRLAGYGPYALLDNGLEGPGWEVSLASVRAVLVPPEAVALRSAGTRAFPVPPAGDSPRRGRLVIRSRRGLSAHDCRPGDPRASEFAELVNVAALNPRRFEETRRDQIQQAADHLESVRATAAQRIADARAEIEAARADTAAVEEAERALVRARADTRERERRRTLLAAARRESRAVARGRGPGF